MSETTIFADGIKNVTLSNGVVRIELVQNGSDNKQYHVATLMLPGNQAVNISNNISRSLKELAERLKSQVQEH